MDYKIILDGFEGPLDLLLSLIEKAKIDIYDIEINTITEQYMEYIYAMEELNLSIASEFIMMAATLLEIKSKMLLPQEVIIVDDEEVELDPREELILRLIEYKKYKEAADELRVSQDIESKVYYKPREDLSQFDDIYEEIQFDLKLLLKSINKIIQRRGLSNVTLDISEIQREEYTLKNCMEELMNRLKIKKSILFEELLSENFSKNEIVTYFLTVLELIKLRKIKVSQEKSDKELVITTRDGDWING
jgi:segregation and condensation protein A